jgi:glycosidase
MTNVRFDSLEDYDDIEIKNNYQEKVVEQQSLSHQQFMQGVYASARDNARTPMQWDNSSNAGFSQGQPWLKVNPNYPEINVAAALDDPQSVFYHYQKLIALRKSGEFSELLIYGTYQLLLPEHPQIFAYLRQYKQQRLLVVANVSEVDQRLSLDFKAKQVLLNNLQQPQGAVNRLDALQLAPYQAIIYVLE